MRRSARDQVQQQKTTVLLFLPQSIQIRSGGLRLGVFRSSNAGTSLNINFVGHFTYILKSSERIEKTNCRMVESKSRTVAQYTNCGCSPVTFFHCSWRTVSGRLWLQEALMDSLLQNVQCDYSNLVSMPCSSGYWSRTVQWYRKASLIS